MCFRDILSIRHIGDMWDRCVNGFNFLMKGEAIIFIILFCFIAPFFSFDASAQTKTIIDGDVVVDNSDVLLVEQYDTLIITGNLTLKNSAIFTIEENAVCIIYGNFIANNKVDLMVGAYLIIGGNLKAPAGSNKLTLNVDSDAAMYVLGDVDDKGGLFDCENTSVYDPPGDGACNYGDIISLEDNENDSTGIYDFFVGGDTEKGVTPVYSDLCDGDAVVISALKTDAYAYQWCDSIGDPISGETGFSYTTNQPGEYFVLIYESATSDADTSYRAKVVGSAISVEITGDNGPLCAGEDVKFTIEGTAGVQLSYNLNGGTMATTTLSGGVDTIAVSGATSNQTLNLIAVTDGSGSCELSESATVVVGTIPADPYSVWNNSSICLGESATLNASYDNAFELRWYADDCDAGTLAGTGSPLIVNPTTTTTYYARTYDAATQCESQGCKSLVVTVNLIPATPMASSNSPVCVGEIIQLSTATVPGANYSWTGPNGFNSTEQNPSFAASWIGNAGTYSVSVIVNGCSSAAASTDLVVDGTTQGGQVAPAHYNPICEGSAIPLLTLNNYNGEIQHWERRLDGGSWEDIGNAGNDTYSETPTSGGTWDYRALVQSGSCNAEYSTIRSITVNPALSITLGANPEVCQNEVSASLSYSATTGSPDRWVLVFDSNAVSAGFASPQNNNLNSESGTISINVPYSIATGVYNAVLKVITDYPICSSIDYPVTITVTSGTPVAVSISGANPVCNGTNVTYTAVPTNGGSSPSYQWKVNGSNVGTDSDSYSYVPSNGDVVSCVLTSNSSCATGSPATSNEITMTVNALPVAAVSSNNGPICENENAEFTITGTSGATVTYSLNGGAATTTVLTGGVANVTVSGATNNQTITLISVSSATCSQNLSETSTVVVNPLPATGEIIPD